MAKNKKTDYIFADAYIGSFSKNMMTKKDLMRVATCSDLDQAETVLREYGYGEAKELKDGEIEGFIKREKNKLYNMVFSTIPDKKALDFMLYPFDYHNVKVCLKSELLGLTPDKYKLVSTGSIEWMKIVAMVRDRNYNFMPLPMKYAIKEALDLYSRSKDPQDIDIVLDKACYKNMLEDASKTKEEFLIGLVKMKIDILNLSSFVRLKMLHKTWDFYKHIFIECGNVNLDTIIQSYEEPFARLGEKLDLYGYKELLTYGGKELEESGDFSLFEKISEDIIMKYNKNAKYVPFGVVPIAGYLHGKDIEIDNLRIVLVGKRYGFSQKEIEERLRDTYV